MLDENNYPDEESLKQIQEWDVVDDGYEGLLSLIEDNTNWPDRQIERRGKRIIYYTYHTGGWSGNEDVISALRTNYLFWHLYWLKTTRGGHYYFKIKPLK